MIVSVNVRVHPSNIIEVRVTVLVTAVVLIIKSPTPNTCVFGTPSST